MLRRFKHANMLAPLADAFQRQDERRFLSPRNLMSYWNVRAVPTNLWVDDTR